MKLINKQKFEYSNVADVLFFKRNIAMKDHLLSL